MPKFLKRIGSDVSGGTAIEYGMILALIFLAIVGAVQVFGSGTVSMWTDIGNKVSKASGKSE